MSTDTSRSRVKIEDLIESYTVDDSDLLIVEDDEDTKQITFRILKQALNGDYTDPENTKFYSSEKVRQIVESLTRKISNCALSSDVKNIEKKITNIIASTGSNQNTEIIDARNGYATLGARLNADNESIANTYMKKVSRDTTGDELYIPGTNLIDIKIIDDGSVTSTVSANIVHCISLNMIDTFNVNPDCGEFDTTYTGFKMGIPYDTTGNESSVAFYTEFPYPAGDYYFYADVNGSVDLTRVTPVIRVIYSDGTTGRFDYTINSPVHIKATSSFNIIQICFECSGEYASAEEPVLTFSDVMFTKNKMYTKYVTYHYESYPGMSIGSIEQDIDNNNYLYFFPNSNGTMLISYYDNSIDLEYLYNSLNSLKDYIANVGGRCSLIKDNGTVEYLDNSIVLSPSNTCSLSDDQNVCRGAKSSLRLDISSSAQSNPKIRYTLDNQKVDIDLVGLTFYINATLYQNFTSKEGINLYLCSDDPSAGLVNYYSFTITKNMMMQGWNTIKNKLSNFSVNGAPNKYNIKYIVIEINRRDVMNGESIWFSSISFNQHIRPTILMCFEGVYDETTEFTLPYLVGRNIPGTIFLNNSISLNDSVKDNLLKYRISEGWDIGCYGCNPNKEWLREDNNWFVQYQCLRKSREYLRDNLVDTPISYSAPYGDLRPISVPILKDLGYKIAKVKADSYCSIFTQDDFAIPEFEISNTTTLKELCDKIDYIVNTGQVLCIKTNNVTEFGDASSATRATFESIVNYICEKRNNSDLQCLTFEQFYNKCVK